MSVSKSAGRVHTPFATDTSAVFDVHDLAIADECLSIANRFSLARLIASLLLEPPDAHALESSCVSSWSLSWSAKKSMFVWVIYASSVQSSPLLLAASPEPAGWFRSRCRK